MQADTRRNKTPNRRATGASRAASVPRPALAGQRTCAMSNAVALASASGAASTSTQPQLDLEEGAPRTGQAVEDATVRAPLPFARGDGAWSSHCWSSLLRFPRRSRPELSAGSDVLYLPKYAPRACVFALSTHVLQRGTQSADLTALIRARTVHYTLAKRGILVPSMQSRDRPCCASASLGGERAASRTTHLPTTTSNVGLWSVGCLFRSVLARYSTSFRRLYWPPVAQVCNHCIRCARTVIYQATVSLTRCRTY